MPSPDGLALPPGFQSPAAFAFAPPAATGPAGAPTVVPSPDQVQVPTVAIPPGRQSPAAFMFAVPPVPVQPQNTDAFLVFFP